jgi:hypothetical protein
MTAEQRQVELAIAKLKSFYDGDLGVVDVIACGARAVPALRALLFARERSGLYQLRCRAVAALGALKEHDVLIEFLQMDRVLADPVERLGEDAVINAAALALAHVRDPRAFEQMLRLAGQKPFLTGVIGALGASGRIEVIPVLITALEDDASRPTARAALTKFGPRARPALLDAAMRQTPSRERESASSVRRRRAALDILRAMKSGRIPWPTLSRLMHDIEPKVAAAACEIVLDRGPGALQVAAVRRLIQLLAHQDWMLQDEIKNCLIAHAETARNVVAEYLRREPSSGERSAIRQRMKCVLRQVSGAGSDR